MGFSLSLKVVTIVEKVIVRFKVKI